MIDIKAIKAAAEAAESRNWTHGANPAKVIALCDEIEMLLVALKLIEWSNDSSIQAQAATEALNGKPQ